MCGAHEEVHPTAEGLRVVTEPREVVGSVTIVRRCQLGRPNAYSLLFGVPKPKLL